MLRARFTRVLRRGAKQKLILLLDPDDHRSFHGPPDSRDFNGTRTEAEFLDLVRGSGAPAVWIGGGEPLEHPGTGKLTRRIVDCGRTVFLETDGYYLRQRIHEFRPVSRLFLTLKFYGLRRSNDLRAGREGTFGRAVEGIRTAKLSGFLICPHILVDAATDLGELPELRDKLLGMDADGLLVSPAPGARSSANREKEAVGRKLTEARKIFGDLGWRMFARLLDEETRNEPARAERGHESGQASEHTGQVADEGVEVR